MWGPQLFPGGLLQNHVSPVYHLRLNYAQTQLLDLFSVACTVEADTSGVLKERLRNPQGGFYFSQDFDVVLLFGLTEMKAYVSWMENVCL